MYNLTLLLLTKNESSILKEWGSWLNKIKALNEIIVVDDYSTDDTKKITSSWANKKISVKFFTRSLDNDFSTQRNFGLSKTKNNWVLFLDADEIPNPDMIDYLNKLIPQNNNCYSFKRHLIYFGNSITHGQVLDDKPIKLFNKKHGKFTGKVHEVWSSSCQNIFTHTSLNHYSVDNLNTLLGKVNLYSSIRAQELFSQHHQTNLLEIIFYPLFKFTYLYFFKLGFLDGVPGLILSLTMSLHSFLNRAKLWHLSQE